MKNSKIAWTTHTFNPWWGCVKVSEGCKHCYAEALAKRTGHHVWGPTAPRRTFNEKHWHTPLSWNRDAELAGERARVFCASMADVFEDNPAIEWERSKLWPLIEATPMLDWLLLTKRPENMNRMVPASWIEGWPANAWALTTVEDDAHAWRAAALLNVPARVRGLSVEPMIGPVDLTNVRVKHSDGLGFYSVDVLSGETWEDMYVRPAHGPAINWVIIGGESGAGCRPMQIEWVRDLMRQCQDAGVPVFMKQLGGNPNKRDNPDEWPEDLRVREFPKEVHAQTSGAV